jgi:SAM-dependent methyltransferase
VSARCDLCGGAGRELYPAGAVVGLRAHVRCEGCGLVWVWPRPDDVLAASAAVYDGARAADDRREARARARQRAWLRGLRLPMGARLLDVGCGAGLLLEAARAAGLEAVGVDAAGDRAAEARARSGAVVHAGTLETLPDELGRFDVIRMNQLIEHVASPRALLAAARGRLAPGGALHLATPNLDALAHGALGPAWRQLGRDDNGHLVLLGPAHVARYAAEVGLAVARLRTRGARAWSLAATGVARRGWRLVEQALEPWARLAGRGGVLEAVLEAPPR